VCTLWLEFTEITPVRIPFETRIARPRSRVHTEPERPYSISFANRIASASVSNGIMHTTGPKISSCDTRHALSTSASTVRSTYVPCSPPGICGVPPPATNRAPSCWPSVT
jgi:hypothetical protein